MDELFQTPYGEVRARELEQLRSSFDTSQILTAVDDLDRFCAQWRTQLQADLLRVHGMARPHVQRSRWSVSTAHPPRARSGSLSAHDPDIPVGLRRNGSS